eukprot:CAMPEP_0184340760 /NCGR_PEP_ID=MMETSP1089-20130417/9408_1 /TAXON_ID=38269 ORGANISM="Gloeochaete wittrockiana, Strain SAG46.84" /NCGR_SAMPLE_ID=MMETSP1089 /ASSEMBLY_ACC=CAM_ASM_000445 /LENGTH=1030 /DNA_ID=CAMNT_0026668707 /DNA_START=160 /DNA_END=3252 /DNA_ORIENTATION=-
MQHARDLSHVKKEQPETDLASSMLVRAPTIRHSVFHSLKGFVERLSIEALNSLRKNPLVKRIERVHMYTVAAARGEAEEENAPWNLDRIDERSGIDGKYAWLESGSEVDVYIVDTGIQFAHEEFGGRAFPSFDAFRNVSDLHYARDCQGHGTHVSGVIGGKTYGVAKNVTMLSVRVLNCEGAGGTDAVLSGLDWILKVHLHSSSRHPHRPAVINMSIAGAYSHVLNEAVGRLVEAGLVVVTAGGNGFKDACSISPASAHAAISVAATDKSDKRLAFSNFGSCINIFAPGAKIRSASWLSKNASSVMSGSSMACPHVTGAVAMYLQRYPHAPPDQVLWALTQASTRDRVADAKSPNRLLFTGKELFMAALGLTSIGGCAWTAFRECQLMALDGISKPLLSGNARYSVEDCVIELLPLPYSIAGSTTIMSRLEGSLSLPFRRSTLQSSSPYFSASFSFLLPDWGASLHPSLNISCVPGLVLSFQWLFAPDSDPDVFPSAKGSLYVTLLQDLHSLIRMPLDWLPSPSPSLSFSSSTSWMSLSFAVYSYNDIKDPAPLSKPPTSPVTARARLSLDGNPVFDVPLLPLPPQNQSSASLDQWIRIGAEVQVNNKEKGGGICHEACSCWLRDIVLTDLNYTSSCPPKEFSMYVEGDLWLVGGEVAPPHFFNATGTAHSISISFDFESSNGSEDSWASDLLLTITDPRGASLSLGGYTSTEVYRRWAFYTDNRTTAQGFADMVVLPSPIMPDCTNDDEDEDGPADDADFSLTGCGKLHAVLAGGGVWTVSLSNDWNTSSSRVSYRNMAIVVAFDLSFPPPTSTPDQWFQLPTSPPPRRAPAPTAPKSSSASSPAPSITKGGYDIDTVTNLSSWRIQWGDVWLGVVGGCLGIVAVVVGVMIMQRRRRRLAYKRLSVLMEDIVTPNLDPEALGGEKGEEHEGGARAGEGTGTSTFLRIGRTLSRSLSAGPRRPSLTNQLQNGSDGSLLRMRSLRNLMAGSSFRRSHLASASLRIAPPSPNNLQADDEHSFTPSLRQPLLS